jgi:hypothetical protein
MIMGRFFVRNQKPEFVGASQKRFAWSIGLALSVVMFVIIIVLELMTPIKIAICILCLMLLFSESAFGVCLGCKIFNWLNRENKYCPGGVCEIQARDKTTYISTIQAIIAVVAVAIFSFFVYNSYSLNEADNVPATMKCQTGKCGAGM